MFFQFALVSKSFFFRFARLFFHLFVVSCFCLLHQDLEMPNPFFDKEDAAPGITPAAIGYRYRKFQLG